MEINIRISNKEIIIKCDVLLIGILILATIFRLYHLDFQGAWLDEIHTLKEADPNLSFKEMYEMINWREGIPHFYFLLVRFLGIIFSHSLYSIRLLSAIFGILSVYSIYLLCKEMKDKYLGYTSATLLAFHPFLIEHSQEGRSYSLLVLFVILSFYRLVIFLKNYSIKNAVVMGLFLGLTTNAQPIGIVNVLSVYIVIILFFLQLKSNAEKTLFFKNTVISGIATLLVFFPVYQIVAKASDATSFWVQKPTFDYVIEVLINLTGGAKLCFFIMILSIIFTIINGIYKSRNAPNKSILNNNFTNESIILIWIFFFFTFMLIKSLGQTSLFLSRYLITLAPAFVLVISFAIHNVNLKYFKVSATLFISSIFLYVLLIEKKYYTTRIKSQFNDICLQIKNENISNEIVVSNWGWLLAYFLDRNDENKNVLERNLDKYINDVKTNSVIQENFWYIDGNSRPYSVEQETQQFLEKNYDAKKLINLQDSWAIHYISKKPIDLSNRILKLNQFKNAKFDSVGSLMFFENSKSSSLPIQLNKGNYSIEISCRSQPAQKLNNENAKFIVFINDKNYGFFEAAEKNVKTIKINYNQENSSMFTIDIAFINDFSKGNLDRNLEILKIEIKRK